MRGLVMAACGIALLLWYFHRSSLQVPTVRLDSMNARAGDLVLFRSPFVDPVHEVYSFFTHVGVLYVDRGRLRILETHRFDDTLNNGRFTSGVHTYDARERLSTYDGDVFLLTLNPALARPGLSGAIAQRFDAYAATPFNEDYTAFIVSNCLFGPSGGSQKLDALFCSQFVGRVLVDVGLLPPTTDVRCLTPESFTDMRVGDMALFTELHRILV